MGVILLAYFIRYNNLFFIRRNMVVGQGNGTLNMKGLLLLLLLIFGKTKFSLFYNFLYNLRILYFDGFIYDSFSCPVGMCTILVCYVDLHFIV